MFGVSGRENCRKKSRLATTKSPRAISCRAMTALGSSAGAAGFSPAAPIRSMERDDATSVSQS